MPQNSLESRRDLLLTQRLIQVIRGSSPKDSPGDLPVRGKSYNDNLGLGIQETNLGDNIYRVFHCPGIHNHNVKCLPLEKNRYFTR